MAYYNGKKVFSILGDNVKRYYNLTTTGTSMQPSTFKKYVEIIGSTFERAVFMFYPNSTSDYTFYEYNGGANSPSNLGVKANYPVQISIYVSPTDQSKIDIVYTYFSSTGSWTSMHYLNISRNLLSYVCFSANVTGVLMKIH